MDSDKTEQIIAFVDSNGVRINAFGNNKSAERLYKRAERVVAAVFLVTSHVSDTEPLRTSMRTTALSVMTSVLALRDEMRASESERVREFRAQLRELVSLLRLLAVAGHVSFANAETLSDAVEDLAGFLSSAQKSSLSESNHLSKESFLSVRDDALPSASNGSRESVPLHSARPAQTPVRSISDGAKTRTNAIISVLSQGTAMGIKDIVSQLPEYSEKMIQRELASMTDMGVVRKEGLKRWSRYTLAPAGGSSLE
jgi:DNA-binding HxlR family transcriptional regulator